MEPHFITTWTGEMVTDPVSDHSIFIRVDDNQTLMWAGIYLSKEQARELGEYLLKASK